MTTEKSIRAQVIQGDLEAQFPFLRSDWFLRAVDNVPDCDIDEFFNITGKSDALSRKDVPRTIAMLRWANRVCDHCESEGRPKNLMLCNRCCLTFYCNRRCQVADWPRHKQRCCVENPVLDKGPQRLARELASDHEEIEDLKCGNETTLHVIP